MTKEITKEKTITSTINKLIDNKQIILHNDDVNTFDHVIESLKKYCDHTTIQAEQCAYIVHYNGKCNVKNGNIYKLIPIYSALLEKGLSVEII